MLADHLHSILTLYPLTATVCQMIDCTSPEEIETVKIVYISSHKQLRKLTTYCLPQNFQS